MVGMPRLKILLSILICSLLVGCGSVAGSNGQATKRMSKADSKKALEEFVMLMEGAKAGEINSFNTSFKPTTEIVQRTKDLLIQKQKDEGAYSDAIDALDLEATLELKNLTSSGGRAMVLERINKAEKLDNENYADSTKFLEELSLILKEFGAEVPSSQGELLEKQNKELIAAGGELWNAWRKLVALCESGKPSLAGEVLMFEKDEDMSEYSAITIELAEAGAEVETTLTRIMTERQESMNKSMANMKSARDEL
jgi:hypothetical protein